MLLHLVRIGAIIALIVVCTFLPFLPGGYDGMAVTLSAMAQGVGFLGLLLVPIGIVWLIYEVSKRAANVDSSSRKDKGYHFATAALIVGAIATAIVPLIAFAHVGVSLVLLSLVLWVYGIWRIARWL